MNFDQLQNTKIRTINGTCSFSCDFDITRESLADIVYRVYRCYRDDKNVGAKATPIPLEFRSVSFDVNE